MKMEERIRGERMRDGKEHEEHEEINGGEKKKLTPSSRREH